MIALVARGHPGPAEHGNGHREQKYNADGDADGIHVLSLVLRRGLLVQRDTGANPGLRRCS
jgi:hypothetical protein